MNILLLGANGQVGWELNKLLSTASNVIACSRDDVDLNNFATIRRAVAYYQPDYIVNAAAYTAVDRAESESVLAYRVNAEAVAVLAEEANKVNAWLIHYSTDYVFDGNKDSSYAEDDSPNPLNVYGKSKLLGEQAIKNSGCKYIIFRTSWVIGFHGHNFVKTIIRLAQEKISLNVVTDQAGSPTAAKLIAKITADAINKTLINSWPAGLYHLAPNGKTTWYELAQYVVDYMRESNFKLALTAHSLKPVITTDYPTLARRPLNSKLATRKLEQVLGFDLPHWKNGVLDVLKKLIQQYQ